MYSQIINSSIFKSVEIPILIVSIVLVVWMIDDSMRRNQNKWIFPVFAATVSFLPFVLSFFRNYLLLLISVLVWLLYLLLRPEYTLEEVKLI